MRLPWRRLPVSLPVAGGLVLASGYDREAEIARELAHQMAVRDLEEREKHVREWVDAVDLIEDRQRREGTA